MKLLIFLIVLSGETYAMDNYLRGAKIYNGESKHAVSCYICHGENAKGSILAPALVDYFEKNDVSNFKNALKKGPGYMPKYINVFSEQDILDIKSWLEIDR